MDHAKASMPQRRWLHHAPPPWVADGATFFITVCCQRDASAQVRLDAEPVAEKLLDAARHYHEQQRWHVHLCLLMPDHVHALVACPHSEGLAGVIAAWKRHTARYTGVVWQKGFFDHRIRDHHAFEEKAHYIRMNPVRRGLVTRPDDWTHFWPR
jgi:putative transposase